MKYILLAIMSLLIYSCKNDIEPNEGFDKSWVSGYWQMEEGIFPSNPQDTTFTFAIIEDSIYFQNVLLITPYGSGLGQRLLFDYSAKIDKIDNEKQIFEVSIPNYPYYGDLNGIRYTPLSATITMANKNQIKFIAFGNFTDSISGETYTNWEVKYNRQTTIIGKTSSNSGNGGSAVQCKGKTKKGVRCQNMTKNASGYCYLHG